MAESQFTRGVIGTTGMSAPLSVSGSDWASAARLHNHNQGRNRVLVPTGNSGHITLAKSSEYIFEFGMLPTHNALVRRWAFAFRGRSDIDVSIGGDSIATEGLEDFTHLRQGVSPRNITLDTVLASQSTAFSSQDVKITIGSATGVDMDAISCVEMPRGVIADGGSELGASLSAFRSGQPIKQASLDSMWKGATDPDVGKRVLLHAAWPHTKDGTVSTSLVRKTSSASFVDMLPQAIPCLARKLREDALVVTSCTSRVFAWVSSGGSAEFRVSTNDGFSSSKAFSNTSPAWSALVADANVMCEDLSASDGLQSATWDDVQIQARAISGTVYIATAIVHE